jgi:GNAT superfamily N-acetyltransferase
VSALACRPGIIAHVIIELVPPDTGRAFEAMRELRPALASRESFVQQVDERQRPDGYRLIGSTPDDDGPALAVASFRVGENLAWGGHLYVDDLSTVPTARKQGHARQLLEWLNAEAARLGIRQVHLDSGVGAERAAAHRLYFTSGYRISSYHFARQG